MLPIRIAVARIGPAPFAADADEGLPSFPSRHALTGTGLVLGHLRAAALGGCGRAMSGDRTAGFSLVEMLVVLAILGLAVGIGAPSIGGIIPSHRLNAAAHAISGEVAQLRVQAQRTGRPMSLTFDEETRRFVSARPGAPSLAVAEWRVLVETVAPARVEPGEIRFLPDGGSTGGRITLSGPGGSRTLVVSRATGAVRRAEVAP